MEIFDIISWTYIALTLLSCGLKSLAESRHQQYTLPSSDPARVTVITPHNFPRGISLPNSRCPASINPFFVPSSPMNPDILSKKIGNKLQAPQHSVELLDRHFLITLNDKISQGGVEAHLDKVCRLLTVPGARGIVFGTTVKNTYFATLDEKTLLRIAMTKEVERVQFLAHGGENGLVVA